jgi:hypothetical protein
LLRRESDVVVVNEANAFAPALPHNARVRWHWSKPRLAGETIEAPDW